MKALVPQGQALGLQIGANAEHDLYLSEFRKKLTSALKIFKIIIEKSKFFLNKIHTHDHPYLKNNKNK